MPQRMCSTIMRTMTKLWLRLVMMGCANHLSELLKSQDETIRVRAALEKSINNVTAN